MLSEGAWRKKPDYVGRGRTDFWPINKSIGGFHFPEIQVDSDYRQSGCLSIGRTTGIDWGNVTEQEIKFNNSQVNFKEDEAGNQSEFKTWVY